MPPAAVSECDFICFMLAVNAQLVSEAQMGGLKEVPVLLLICFHSRAAQEARPRGLKEVASEPRVMVKAYNGINLSSTELSRAEREAEKIFLYAGIQLRWTVGLLGADVNDNTPSEKWNSAALQLRIWPRAKAGKRSTSSETLGFCLSLENGDAAVLADAIHQKRAIFGSTKFAHLLGLAIAHELGHLLLQSEAHSVFGIMRARWSEKALRDDDRGYLRFTPREAESMKSEVKRRTG